MKKLTPCGRNIPLITPADPARKPPTPKVNIMTQSMSMPISRATSLFSETARIALPIRVRSTSQYRPSIRTDRGTENEDLNDRNVDAADRYDALQNLHLRIGFEARAIKSAKGILQEERGADSGDQRHQPGDCHEAGDRRRVPAISPLSSIPDPQRRSSAKSTAEGCSLRKPVRFNASAKNTVVKAPAMKTSPWAKLIMSKMPYTKRVAEGD